MKPIPTIAVAIAGLLLGLSFAWSSKPTTDEPTPLSIEAFEEYQQLLEKSRVQQKQILNLEIDLAEAKEKIQSLTVGKPAVAVPTNSETELPDPIDADNCADGSCQQVPVRRRLFGRFR